MDEDVEKKKGVKLSSFKENPADIEGVWMDHGACLRLKIARAGNSEFRKELHKIMRPFRRQLRSKEFSDEEMDKFTMQAAAKKLLLDWKGLEDDEGNPIPYSPEEALKAFEEYPEFWYQVNRMSGDMELFQMELNEGSAKN